MSPFRPHPRGRRASLLALAPLLAVAACDPETAAPTPVASDAPPESAGEGGIAPEAGTDAGVPPTVERVLVDHRAWHTYEAALDPLGDHQPAQLECAQGWSVDSVSGTLDVETASCNYALLAHPAAFDVEAGATLRLRLWHFDLVSAEPASAHVALLASEMLLWETHISIPDTAGAVDVEIVAPRAIAEGEPLRWHLHNHGQNSYLLSEITVVTEGLE